MQKAVELLQKHNAILGGKVTIRLSEEQWRQVEARASARCNELLSDTTDRKTAIRNAELLSAALAVSACEIATEANPTRGFLIRASTGHARRRYRPLATERVAQELKHHLTTLKTSLRYTRSRTERDELRAQIKECRKLVRIREEEATKQREGGWKMRAKTPATLSAVFFSKINVFEKNCSTMPPPPGPPLWTPHFFQIFFSVLDHRSPLLYFFLLLYYCVPLYIFTVFVHFFFNNRV